MPSENEHNNSEDTVSRLEPVLPNGDKISWKDSNDARIPGLIKSTKEFWKRRHLFEEFYSHRAVSVGSKLAVDSHNAIQFVLGTVNDPRDYDNPAPPTPARISGLPGSVKWTPRAVDAPIPSHIIIAPHLISKEDGRVLESLEYVFGSSPAGPSLISKAQGSGEKLLDLLEKRGKAAQAKAKAVVNAEFTRLVTDGVKGELTVTSLTKFLHDYETIKATQTRDISDEEELEMINTIAFKSPEVREMYELKATVSAPSDLDSAQAILEDILRGRQHSEDIDRITAGDAAPVLAAPAVDPSSKRIAELETLVAELRDPNKNKVQFVKAPRDAEGNVSHYIKGMQPCKCKKLQPGDPEPGGHLARDCITFPFKPKQKEQKKNKEAPVKESNIAELTCDMSEAEIDAALMATFGVVCDEE